MQIPKVQKKTESLTVFFVLFGSGPFKALSKMLVKSTSADENTCPSLWSILSTFYTRVFRTKVLFAKILLPKPKQN